MKQSYTVLAFFLILAASQNAYSQLSINEFMAVNRSIAIGMEASTRDWIELYNPSDSIISLRDYYLTDDPTDLKKYRFDNNLSVPIQGYRLLLSTESAFPAFDEFPFSLRGEGEFIALVAPDGITIIDSISYGTQYPDRSFGKAADTSDWQYLAFPTPEEENSVGFEALPEVVFDLEAGLYNRDSVILNLNVTHPDANIYYTLDGTEPDTSSNLYIEALILKESASIRAKAILDSASSIVSSYATFLLQAPKKNFILNLNGPEDWFWDPDSGIQRISKFELGSWGLEEDPFNFLIDVELFSGEGDLLSKHQGRLRQHGAGSTFNLIKSMRLHFSPSQAIQIPIYEQKPHILNHRVVILRQGGNFTDWAGLAVQDVLSSEYQSRSDWGLDYQAYQPVNVYINGKFFALMFFRERHDRHYYANNLGADPDEVSVIRRWGGGAEINPGDPFYQRFNSTANFFSSSNFADTAAVQAAARLIDIENYFHYLYYNHHIVNTDWPYNNYKMAHPGGDEKWRFCVYDNDFGFGDQNFYQSGLAILMQGGQEGYWLPRLMENDSLREYFINYYLDLLNTEFDPKDFEESLKAVEAKLRPDIDAHLAHWVPRLQANGNFVQPWEEYIDNIYPGFSRMRIQARKGLGSAFNLNKEYNLSIEISPSTAADIQLNTLTLQDFPWSGRYLHGNPIQVRVKARPGYRFVGWTDPLLPDTSFLRIDFEQSCTLTALFERDNSYQPELVINEVVYDDRGLQNGSNDWLELHNASSQAIQLDNWVLGDETDENRFVFPAGTSLQAGGFTIICRDPAAFLGAYPGTKIIPRALGFGLGKEDQIRIWDQNGLLIDSLAYQDQAPWPILAEGRGGILALRDPALIVNYPQSWISREDYRPTPGRANQIINTLGDERRISCIHFDAELFPNPVKRELTLYFADSQSESVQLRLLDLLGRPIYSEEIPLRLGANLVRIPLSFLTEGHYFLQLEQDGMIETTRIVKSRL